MLVPYYRIRSVSFSYDDSNLLTHRYREHLKALRHAIVRHIGCDERRVLLLLLLLLLVAVDVLALIRTSRNASVVKLQKISNNFRTSPKVTRES
jgi:hypothetical protein